MRGWRVRGQDSLSAGMLPLPELPGLRKIPGLCTALVSLHICRSRLSFSGLFLILCILADARRGSALQRLFLSSRKVITLIGSPASGQPHSTLPKRLLRLAGLGLAGYLGVIVTLLLLENTLLFHPKSHGGYWSPAPAQLRTEEVWLRTSGGIAVHAWWCPISESEGAILFCHGNAGNLSHRASDILAMQRSLGKSVLVFDYPGFGRSGDKPSEGGCYAAADAAYDWLAARIPTERMVILGQSLGGGVAIDLASRRAHGGLALFKTFTSVPDLAQRLFPFLPARWLVHNRFDNFRKIGRCLGPVFIAHGDSDHLIPLSQARQLFVAAPAPKRFWLLPGCGHHGGLSPLFLAELAGFLEGIENER
jgi:pimeloyl-ACP methyl ester carboxylesterase